MAEQRVGYLRDRERKHEIEEQFGIGDAAMLVRQQRAKQRSALIVLHHAPSYPVRRASGPLTFRYPGLQRQRVKDPAHLAFQDW